MDIMGFIRALELYEVLLSFVAVSASLLYGAFRLGRWHGTGNLRNKYREAIRKAELIESGLRSDKFIWEHEPIRPPAGYLQSRQTSIPVLTIANLKGGVGKTTLAANLAAYFHERWRPNTETRVLLIDFDYQGSLSSMLMTAVGSGADGDAIPELAIELLRGGNSPEGIVRSAENLRPLLRNACLISASDRLAETENRLMLDWFLDRHRDASDLRYVLAEYLASSCFQDSFDIVLIDTPPRLTTGFLNALCASTHLIVPTIYDRLSAIAVARFLKQIDELRPMLFPALRTSGIVGMMLQYGEDLSPREARALAFMKTSLMDAGLSDGLILEDARIPRRANIAAAAGGAIAYLDDAEIRTYFDQLGTAVTRRM